MNYARRLTYFDIMKDKTKRMDDQTPIFNPVEKVIQFYLLLRAIVLFLDLLSIDIDFHYKM